MKDKEVICSAYAKCKKPCHHAKPHKPATVADQGYRGDDQDTHIDYPNGIVCTTKGRCDMGLFVKCYESKETDEYDIDPSHQRLAGHTHLLGHDPIGGRGREWR